MLVKFEPSGTHLKREQLKARFDFYPEPADRSYASQYVYVPVFPEGGYPGRVNEMGDPVDQADYDAWEAGLPHIWRVNPALCVFIGVDENITKALLAEYIGDVYKPNVLATIADIMARPSTPEQPHLSAHLISPYMRGKTKLSTVKTTSFDEQAKTYINQRLAGFQMIGPAGGGEVEHVEPHTITAGPGATDRSASSSADNIIDATVPADGTGTLDTWEIWFASDATGVEFATFIHEGSNVLSTRDTESVGDILAGSKSTSTGLSTDVATGDYAGAHYPTGSIEREGGTGLQCWYLSTGDYIPCTSQTFTPYTFKISIYATGEEGGTAHEKSLSDTLTIGDTLSKAAGKARTDSMAVADSPAKAFGKPPSDAFSIADTLVKESTKSPADSMGITDSLDRIVEFTREFSETLTVVDNIAKNVGKPLADAFTLADNLASQLFKLLTLSDTLAITDAVIKNVGLAKSDSVPITESVAKSIQSVRLDTMAIVDAILKMAGVYKADSIGITEALAKSIGLGKVDTEFITDVLAKAVGQVQTDAVLFTDSPSKGIGLPESDTLLFTDTPSKGVGLIKADSLAISDSLVKSLGLFKFDTILLVDALAKSIYLPEVDTLIITDVCVPVLTIVTITLSLADAMTITDTLRGDLTSRVCLRLPFGRVAVIRLGTSRIETCRDTTRRVL